MMIHQFDDDSLRLKRAATAGRNWIAGTGKLGMAQILVGSGLAIAHLITSAGAGYSQFSSDQPMISVPPPPPTVPVPQPPSMPGSTPNETVFQAPSSSTGRYMVFVNGDSPYLVQQVQTLEPKASVQQYQGRPIIQVGTYSDEASARQQVEALRMQGVNAEISSSGGSNFSASSGFSAPPPPGRSSPYVVIVPGNRDALPTLAQQAMSLGVRQDSLQMKDAPLGWHLEIGPFGDYKEAKEVSNYLNRGGLDSRVYYSR